jgi:predicted acylesterase/phospholipase RssA
MLFMKKTPFTFFHELFDLVFTRAEQTKVGLVLSGGGAKGFAHIGV